MKLDNDDKKKKAAEQLTVDAVVSPEPADVEDETDDDEFIDDFETMAEDDTDEDELEEDALDEDDDSDEPEDTEEEVDEEEADDIEEAQVESKKEGGKLSKAEIRLIELKKQNKQLQKDKQELEARVAEKAKANEKEALKQKFISEDYDEDVAEKMANDELRIRQLEERQAVLDFRDANDDLFAKYPQAKAQAQTIMQNIRVTGMTAEQICRGLYGAPKAANEIDQRAIDSVKGNIPSKSARKPIQSQTKQVSLTAKELAHKARLERAFLDGQKMSIEEYQKFLNRNKSTYNSVTERRI